MVFAFGFLAQPRNTISSLSYLSFQVSLNATSIRVGQNLTVHVWVTNTAPYENNVTAEHRYPLGLIPYMCNWSDPIYFGILAGYYVEGNASDGVWLPTIPEFWSCPYAYYLPQWVLFNPQSSTANICGFFENFATGSNGTVVYPITIDKALSIPGTLYSQIPPGTYTLVVGDEWGQVALAWFSVTT